MTRVEGERPSETPVPVYRYASKYRDGNPLKRLLIRRFFAAVLDVAGRLAPASVLEVGCHEGDSTERLLAGLPSCTRLCACDIEDRLVAATRQRVPAAEARLASIYDLPYGADTFDLVMALEVLEHLDDPARGLAELLRVSRGPVLVSVPDEPLFRLLNVLAGQNLRALGNTPGHLRHWSSSGAVRFVSASAAVLEVRTPTPWTVVLAEKRIRAT